MLSGSSSTRSSRLGTISSVDWGSQDTQSYNRSLLGVNLLEDDIDHPPITVRPKVSPRPLVPVRPVRQDASGSRFIIAVDFGTTFTGRLDECTKNSQI